MARGAGGGGPGRRKREQKKTKKIIKIKSNLTTCITFCSSSFDLCSLVETEEKPSQRRRTMTAENRTRNIIQ